MFVIAKNTKGELCVVTDNPDIAEAIRDESQHAKKPVPVWFTGAPTIESVRALADGLARDFDRETTFRKGAVARFPKSFSAMFRE